MPFFIGKKVRLRRIGKINLTYTGRKKIHIGTVLMFNTSSNMETIWENNGQITIEGPLMIAPSAIIHTGENGQLIFKGKNRIGAHTYILCHNKVSIGFNTGISWYVQICDTDFHFFKNIDTNKVSQLVRPIEIGQDVWIGNHVIVSKGVKIADGCICGMNSMITKNCDTQNSLLIGIPARSKNVKVARIFDSKEEKELLKDITVY